MQPFRVRFRRFLAQAPNGLALAALLCATHVGIGVVMRWGPGAATGWEMLWRGLPLVMAVKLVTFAAFRVPLPRYLTFHDLVTLVEATTVSSLLLGMLNYLTGTWLTMPPAECVMDWLATIVVIGGSQAATRCYQERYRPLLSARRRVRALIVGADENGAAILQNVHRSARDNYQIVGFLDDDLQRAGRKIGGVRVLGQVDDARLLAELHGATEILVTTGGLPGRRIKQLVEACRQHDIRIRMLPNYEQLLHGDVAVRTRDVSIEDLLRRETINLDDAAARRWLAGRVLMVSGSAGSIGSEICRQLLRFGPRKLLMIDRSENGQFMLERELRAIAGEVELQTVIADIGDAQRMRTVLGQHRPEVIFHAAAYKHVPLMEGNPGEAVKNNVLGTRTLADLAHEQGLESFVMISTDKAVNPTSVMGACKRVAEMYVQSLAERSDCRFVTVRFGNVLDSTASVLPIFREQIARGGPVTVTDPRMTRYFMTIPEASQLVIQAATMGRGGEIYVLDMGEPVRILDLAEEMIRLSGLRLGVDVEIEYIGLRPGEKLFEELHIPGEQHQPTSHPKIMVARRTDAALQVDIHAALANLERVTESPPQSVVDALRGIVAEYQPSGLPEVSLRVLDPAEVAPPAAPPYRRAG